MKEFERTKALSSLFYPKFWKDMKALLQKSGCHEGCGHPAAVLLQEDLCHRRGTAGGQEDQRPLRARGRDAHSALSNHPPSI